MALRIIPLLRIDCCLWHTNSRKTYQSPVIRKNGTASRSRDDSRKNVTFLRVLSDTRKQVEKHVRSLVYRFDSSNGSKTLIRTREEVKAARKKEKRSLHGLQFNFLPEEGL